MVMTIFRLLKAVGEEKRCFGIRYPDLLMRLPE